MSNASKTPRRHQLIEPQKLIQVLVLTPAELAENAQRATRKGWEPKVKVCCAKCGTESPFATQDELAVSRWKTIFFPGEAQEVLCPQDNA